MSPAPLLLPYSAARKQEEEILLEATRQKLPHCVPDLDRGPYKGSKDALSRPSKWSEQVLSTLPHLLEAKPEDRALGYWAKAAEVSFPFQSHLRVR